MEWSIEAAHFAATENRLEDWIDSYLRTGKWINLGLADGLKKERRWWIGPVLLPIKELIRTCGPEDDMPYKTDLAAWEKRTGELAFGLDNVLKLPPVIAQSITGELFLRDGNHRVEAASKKGWQTIWGIIWFDSEKEWQANKDKWTTYSQHQITSMTLPGAKSSAAGRE